MRLSIRLHPDKQLGSTEEELEVMPYFLRLTSYATFPTPHFLHLTSYTSLPTPYFLQAAVEAFQRLTSAYNVLSRPLTRREYDHPTSYILHPTSYILHPTS